MSLDPAHAADPAAVTVRTDRTSYTKGGTIVVTVANAGKQSIFLPGCNHYLVERLEGGSWKTSGEKHCFWEGYAVEIGAGATLEFQEPLEGRGPGTYRIRVDFHTGCQPGKPISEAGCRDQGTVTSAELTLL